MVGSDYRLKWLIYAFLCITADAWDTIASSLVQDKQPKMMSQGSAIDSLTDDQVRELQRNSSPLTAEPNSPRRCSYGMVTKRCCCWVIGDNDYIDPDDPEDRDVPEDCPEANAHDILFLRTTIPVPRVRRVIDSTETSSHVIFMDYIKGPTLAEVWSTYSLWQKIKVALTLRRYVCQLRRVTAFKATPPGPISEYGPRPCDVPSIFGARFVRGPFASYQDLSSFMNRRYAMYFDQPRARLDTSRKEEKFDDALPLVLTHNDLNPRNIIVGEDGRLWVLDWAWSGFYPRWFEFCAMSEQVETEKSRGWYNRFWELMIPFVCGPYFGQELWLTKAAYGLYYR